MKKNRKQSMRRAAIGISAVLLTAFLLFGLFACGDSSSETNTEEEQTEEQDTDRVITLNGNLTKEDKTVSPDYALTGVWRTDATEDGKWLEADIADETIVLRSLEYTDSIEDMPMSASVNDASAWYAQNGLGVHEDAIDIYWIGSFVSPNWQSNDDIKDYCWTSVVYFDRSDLGETRIEGDILDFTYTDKTLQCSFMDDEGVYHSDVTFYRVSHVAPNDAVNDILGIEVETDPDSIPTCNHDFDNGVVTKEATCETNGKMVYTCSKCGYEKYEVIPAEGHDYQGAITKYPTCTEVGVKTYTCHKCGSTYDCDEPLAEHNWKTHVEDVVIEETGHWETQADTMRVFVCLQCGNQYETEDNVIQHIYTGHNGSGNYTAQDVIVNEEQVWVVDEPAHEETVTTYVCNICGAVKED